MLDGLTDLNWELINPHRGLREADNKHALSKMETDSNDLE